MELKFFVNLMSFICSFIFVSLSETNLHSSDTVKVVSRDILKPYSMGHGPKSRTHRQTRSIQPSIFGNFTHEVFPSLQTNEVHYPILEEMHFVRQVGENYWDKKKIMGHYFMVNNPLHTFSVLEAHSEEGCPRKKQASAEITGKMQNCLLSTNAGFFNTHDHSCLGDIISNGRIIQFEGIQNAHFGILKDGSLFTGYVPDDHTAAKDFEQLISGVVWLVRDGKNYVDISRNTESSDTQETGSLDTFIQVTSARIAVGHDKLGRVVIIAIEGKTQESGVNLYEFADLLIEFGVVNAINLDGGGSMTTVINGTLANYPGDICESKLNGWQYNCARNISTVLCVRDPECGTDKCNGHGVCKFGKCECEKNWTGANCDQLQCGKLNCSGHGLCTADGCNCNDGWKGLDCNIMCGNNTYGQNCKYECLCLNSYYCNPVNGACSCNSGYSGKICDRECEYGRFGNNCRNLCNCNFNCPCHPISGKCYNRSELLRAYSIKHSSQCLHQIYGISYEAQLARHEEQYRLYVIALLTFATIACISLIGNFYIICGYMKKSKNSLTKLRISDQIKLLEISNSEGSTAEYCDKNPSDKNFNDNSICDAN